MSTAALETRTEEGLSGREALRKAECSGAGVRQTWLLLLPLPLPFTEKDLLSLGVLIRKVKPKDTLFRVVGRIK